MELHIKYFGTIFDEFRKNDKETVNALEFLLRKDQEYTELRKIPNLFWYGVGTPKR